jgi:DNA repair ATPase RecN
MKCEGTEPLTEIEKQAHREAREIRDELRDLELTVERLKLTALRLRAVALAARKFADRHPATLNQAERELISALKDLDWHDANHSVFVHIDGARRRGLPTY